MSGRKVTLTLRPEDAEWTLLPALRECSKDHGHRTMRCSRLKLAEEIEAQLPKPKPAEPTGLGAVVVEDFGPPINDCIEWTRVSRTSAKPWLADGLLGKRVAWSALDDDIRVLSEGVQT